MESKILSYGETALKVILNIIKSAFHKKTTSYNIIEIEINRIDYLIKLHMVIKVHLNTKLDIGTPMGTYHH